MCSKAMNGFPGSLATHILRDTGNVLSLQHQSGFTSKILMKIASSDEPLFKLSVDFD